MTRLPLNHALNFICFQLSPITVKAFTIGVLLFPLATMLLRFTCVTPCLSPRDQNLKLDIHPICPYIYFLAHRHFCF